MASNSEVSKTGNAIELQGYISQTLNNCYMLVVPRSTGTSTEETYLYQTCIRYQNSPHTLIYLLDSYFYVSKINE